MTKRRKEAGNGKFFKKNVDWIQVSLKLFFTKSGTKADGPNVCWPNTFEI